MEKIIKGFYRSSFSTNELNSRKRDVIFREISVEGRKTLTNTHVISEVPADLVFLKTTGLVETDEDDNITFCFLDFDSKNS